MTSTSESPENSESMYEDEDLTQSSSSSWSEIYVDPVRDVDIAPCLRGVCGCMPCCCCLYNEVPDEDDDEYVDFGGGDDERSRRPRRPKHNPFPVNRNVLSILFLTVFFSVADSLWKGTVFSAYLYETDGGRNEYVGYVLSIQMLARLVVSFPGQPCVGPSTMMKIGGVITLMATMGQTYIVAWLRVNHQDNRDPNGAETLEHRLAFYGFCVAAVLWGAASGLVLEGPTLVLFNESLYTEGKRGYLVVKELLTVLSNVVGPLISIIVFAACGHNRAWKQDDLVLVLYVGMGLEVIVGALMFAQKDEWILDGDGMDGSIATNDEQYHMYDRSVAGTKSRQGQGDVSGVDDDDGAAAAETGSAVVMENMPSSDQDRACYKSVVPALFYLHNLIFAAGSGLSVQFFPLYFMNVLKMSPLQVQSVFMVLPILMKTAAQTLPFFSRKLCFSTMETIFFAKAISVTALYFISLSDESSTIGDLTIPRAGAGAFVVVLYLLRTVSSNAVYPMEMMLLSSSRAFFHSSNRRKEWWRQFHKTAIVASAVGAAVGGLLVDRYGYARVFLCTAVTQSAAVLLLGSLVPIVPNVTTGGPDDEDEDERNVGPNGQRIEVSSFRISSRSRGSRSRKSRGSRYTSGSSRYTSGTFGSMMHDAVYRRGGYSDSSTTLERSLLGR